MPPQSTQTEMNEHVCLQWDVSLSEPAVTRLEGNCWEWPLYLSVIYLKYLPRYFFFCFTGSLSRSSWERMNVTLLPDALRRSDIGWWKMPPVHDKLSETLIIRTDAEDCPWRMTVSAALAASVTNHQVIISLVRKIASASMTTFATHCISMRIKTIYIWRVQAEVVCAAESPCEEIWEKYKIPKKGSRDDKNLLH